MKLALSWFSGGVLVVAAFCLGYVVHRNELVPLMWRAAIRDAIARSRGATATTTTARGDAFPLQHSAGAAATDADKEAILALGYLQATRPASATSGVTCYEPTRAWTGLNLYTSGNAPQATLMDMNGRVLHTWKYEFERVWSPSSRPNYVREAATHYWRRAYLYPNGDLLAIFEGVGLIKVDKDSKLLWSYRGGCHHDVFVTPDGDIYVLTSEPQKTSWLSPSERVIDNGIAVLDAQGHEKHRTSLLECLRHSAYAPLLDHLAKRGDVLHANTISVLDGSQEKLSPAFRKGNVLLSFLGCDTVAVVDMDHEAVVWAITGMWRAQHQPELLDNGNLLVFDNRGGTGGKSRILEVNPLTQRVAWQYPGEHGPELYSQWCGSAARLPNGNTLITETDNGRALEVTPKSEVVWEYVNPNQTVENGVTLVSALFEVVRLPQDYCAGWLKSNAGEQL